MPDLRSVFRTLRRSPLLSLVVVLSLALGIGANTVVFSWLNSAVFHPLPGVEAPIVLVETKDDTGNYVATSWLEYREMSELVPSFAAIAAHRQRSVNLGDTAVAERVYAELVTANFFSVLGLQPQLGRFFRPEEAAQPGAAAVAVISDSFWRRHFAGAADVLGQPLKLNGRVFTIIGVAPDGFRGGMNYLSLDVFLPLTMAADVVPASSELTSRYNRAYTLIGRLQPGATLAQARGELAAAAQHLLATHPETNRGLAYELLPAWRSPRGGDAIVFSLLTLQVFAALILVVVCTNTANLLLASASTRRREIGVKLALGAGARRIVLQLLLESVCLALLGAGGGLLVTLWGIDAIGQIPLPGNLPIHLAPELDWASVAFAAGLATVCGVAFGLAPALQLARADVIRSLRGGRGEAAGRSRLRDLLVGVEVAVALVVLVLAGLFLQSFRHTLTTNPGFDPDRVLLATIDFGGRGYNGKTGGALLDEFQRRLAARAGVGHVAAANYVPLDLHGFPTGVIDIAGREFDPNRKIRYSHVTPGYFATLGIPLVRGGDLQPRELAGQPPDAVINEEMAQRFWPEADPVGQRFEVDGTVYNIAGVARTPKLEKMNELPRPAAWLAMRDRFVSAPTVFVRAEAGDPRALLPALRATLAELDPELALLDVRTLARHLSINAFLQRVPAQMLAVLGPAALALAAIGLYAILSYSVAQRTAEIGVRLTLGATPGSIMRLVMWQSLRVVLVASVIGWGIALLAGWYLQPALVRVPFGDPLVYGGVPLLLLVVAILACWIPARRATRINPLAALQAE